MMVKGNTSLILAVWLSLAFCLTAWAGPGKVYVVPVRGTVEPGMAAYIKRALDSITEDKDAVVVFEMDTFGGRVDAALDIVEAISVLPKERTVAFVEKRAISAGALIALASGTLIMKDHTLIGDCAPIIQAGDETKEAGEKIQTVLRAQFRTLAKRNGYPEVLAEAMVSKEMEVFQIESGGQTRFMDKTDYEELSAEEKKQISGKKTVVAQGELLTMDDHEARMLSFSKASVKDLENALAFLGLADRDRVVIHESWSEQLVRMIQPFLPILMLIGIGAIYTEIKAPGFGLPGIIGIVCLGLVFFNQYLVGLADYTELMMLMAGVLLLGVEVFVLPGFGIAGVAGLGMIALGLVLSFQGFVLPDPDMPWESGIMLKNFGMVMGSFLGALLVSFSLVRFVLPHFSRLVKGPYLTASLEQARVFSDNALPVSVGDTGVTLTPLRPSGKVKINSEKMEAMTQGDFIGPNLPVRVLAVTRNQVVVREIES